MTGYYDIVLGLIPVSLAGVTGLLVFAGFSITTAIPLASIVAVALIGHAMFVSPPTGTTPEPAPSPAPEASADPPTNPAK